MARVISFHSYRGGTGKSNVAANLAVVAAQKGKRVGVIDADIQSPGIHTLFGMRAEQMPRALNDFLWGNCAIEETAHDLTEQLDATTSGQPFGFAQDKLRRTIGGRVFLIPSSIQASDISRILREGYDLERLHQGFEELIGKLQLDALLIDTHPGLNEETLLSLSVAHALVILLRPDQQDYEGTSVTLQVAQKLNVPRLELLVNYAPPQILDQLQYKIAQAFNRTVLGVLPYSKEMLALGSQGIFVLRYPKHPMNAIFQQIAARLLA